LELETQAEIAQALEYITPEKATELSGRAAEVGRLINGMLNHFKQLPSSGGASRTCDL